MALPRKTDGERLRDAANVIRQQNIVTANLRRELRQAQRDNDTAEAIRREIFGLAARPPEPPDWIGTRGGKSGSRGSPMAMLSDLHYGEVVDPAQVGGVNKYNAAIARKRIERFGNTTIDLCFNHMGRARAEYPGFILPFGGDMIGGDIHEELMATNERTAHQSVNDLTDILGSLIEKFASKFGRVFVPGVVGNHGRSTHKTRMKNRVFTNYDWSIYCNLERHFKKEKYIRVCPASDADFLFSVFGHRYLLTHGDSLGVKGGDGIIGALGPIMRGALKMHNSEAQIGRDFDTLLIGHWHQYITLRGLICNNSVKGYDEYARLALRAPYSRPSQALWFSHPEHGITAHWQVYLEPILNHQPSKEWVSWK
jgi:hypothetical protein